MREQKSETLCRTIWKHRETEIATRTHIAGPTCACMRTCEWVKRWMESQCRYTYIYVQIHWHSSSAHTVSVRCGSVLCALTKWTYNNDSDDTDTDADGGVGVGVCTSNSLYIYTSVPLTLCGNCWVYGVKLRYTIGSFVFCLFRKIDAYLNFTWCLAIKTVLHRSTNFNFSV